LGEEEGRLHLRDTVDQCLAICVDGDQMRAWEEKGGYYRKELRIEGSTIGLGAC
jgi:hypothetical protein